MLLDGSYGKAFDLVARNCTLYDENRCLVVFVVTNGCRANFLYVYHVENRVRLDTGFGSADLLLPWPRKQGLNPSESCPP